MDTAIDHALLKTGFTEELHRGEKYIMRGFAVDTEDVREKLERMAYGAEEIRLIE